MTCSIVVVQGTGAGPSPTWTPLTGLTGRYCTMNSATPGTANPCKVPAAGLINYSFWVETALEGSGAFNSVRNIYWFCDGNTKNDWELGTTGGFWGGKRASGDNGCPTSVTYHSSNEYQIASGVVGTSGYSLVDAVNGHAYYMTAPNGVIDLDTCTSAAPLLIDSTQYITDFRSKSLLSQVGIGPNGIQGDKAPKTFSWMFDEY